MHGSRSEWFRRWRLMGLNTSHPCPECGHKTLTKRGITVEGGGGATWLSCINCDWEEYEE